MRRRGAFLFLLALVGTWLVAGVSPVAANRFGPPWMARVVVDQSTVYGQPDLSAPPIGRPQHGAILVVTGQQTDDAGHEWARTTLGFVPSQDVVEYLDPWVADVTADSVPVYAK